MGLNIRCQVLFCGPIYRIECKHPVASSYCIMAESTGITEEFGDIDISDRRRIGVDDSLLHELDVFNDDIQPAARKMEDLLELAEDMLQYLPAKPKRVFSDKLAKWKAGEGKYSTQQRITDACV